MTENKINHWQTKKGKETLYNVFVSLIEWTEWHKNRNESVEITFQSVASDLRRKGFDYKKGYIFHAIQELARLGFVRIKTVGWTGATFYYVTKEGWEFWKKRKQIKGEAK